jgi:hypothetical protein
MSQEIRHRLRVETERLTHLEEELAFASYHAICRDAEASAERLRLLDQIEVQKLKIEDLEAAL